MRFFSKKHKITLGVSIFFLLLLLTGCGEWEQEKPRFVIALVDETDSFKLDNTMFWPEVLPWIATIVNRLQPGDKFCVIGIDGHGFDTDDVRIPIETLDESTLKAVIQKRGISERVMALTRRQERHRATDILGALYHATYFLEKEKGYRRTIIIFSDMIHYPWPPTTEDAADLWFPEDTEVYCFYVNASGRKNWENIINTWVSIFNSAGLQVTKDCFYQRDEVKSQIDKIFPSY